MIVVGSCNLKKIVDLDFAISGKALMLAPFLGESLPQQSDGLQGLC